LPADVLFTGGAVFTGTGEPLHGHAVVVTGDRITAVVPESEASAHIGEATRVVDLGGALLSPGFQDAHVHPLSAGVELLMCNLTEATDAADAVARVEAYADANPDEAWIQGGGWSMDHFPGGAPVRTLPPVARCRSACPGPARPAPRAAARRCGRSAAAR